MLIEKHSFGKNTTEYVLLLEIDEKQQSNARNDGKPTIFKKLKEYNGNRHQLSS
jgi:hypothetical protein